MNKAWRQILIGVVFLILFTSACNYAVPFNSTPVGTILADGSPTSSAAASTNIATTNTPLTPAIPITGENVVEMQCQFCVNDQTHAVFIFPDFAIFDVESSSPVTCLTAEVINGKRVLVCHSLQLTTFNLKICSDTSNCLLYPVALQACPLLTAAGTPRVTSTPSTPVFLTPINTLLPSPTPRRPGDATPIPTQVVGSTPVAPTQTGLIPTIQPSLPPIVTTVPPPVPTSTNQPPPPPTDPPAPTNPPAPTDPPATDPPPPATDEPKPTKDKKDTKTPKASPND